MEQVSEHYDRPSKAPTNTTQHKDNTGNGNKDRDQRRKNHNKPDGPKREAILDLNKYINTKIRVRFIGGRQVVGVLEGFDQLMNLVLKDVEETLRGM